MQVISAQAVARATPYPDLIDALSEAFAAPGAIEAPPRAHHPVPVAGRAERTLLLMPAWDRDGVTVVKLVMVAPDNGARGLPAVQGAVLVGDGESGAWRLALDGGELTARRTAAASALAARHLARQDAERLFIVGTGRLSTALIEAHAAVRPIRSVKVWGRRPEAVASVIEWAEAHGFEADEATLEEGASEADVISCATLSTTPLIRGDWLRPGVHVDLVGAFRPSMRETDGAAVSLASVFVDTPAGAKGEAGDLLQAALEGAFDFDDIKADLFALCSGEHPGRVSAQEVTLFKSVGASLEDYAAARLAAAQLGM